MMRLSHRALAGCVIALGLALGGIAAYATGDATGTANSGSVLDVYVNGDLGNKAELMRPQWRAVNTPGVINVITTPKSTPASQVIITPIPTSTGAACSGTPTPGSGCAGPYTSCAIKAACNNPGSVCVGMGPAITFGTGNCPGGTAICCSGDSIELTGCQGATDLVAPQGQCNYSMMPMSSTTATLYGVSLYPEPR